MTTKAVQSRQWFTDCQEHPATTPLPPHTPLYSAARNGWATSVAPTPSHLVSFFSYWRKSSIMYLWIINSWVLKKIFWCSVFHRFPLSYLPEDQAHVAPPQRPWKRLQLLCDPGGWRQVIRQHVHKQELGASPAGGGWMAAGRPSGLGSEELRQPATTSKQIRLQEVLWEKGPLSILVFLNEDSTNKGLFQLLSDVRCTCCIMQREHYYWLYLWLEELPWFYFWCAFFNRSFLWVFIYALLYRSLSVESNNIVCVYCVVCRLVDWKTHFPRQSYFVFLFVFFLSFWIVVLLGYESVYTVNLAQQSWMVPAISAWLSYEQILTIY